MGLFILYWAAAIILLVVGIIKTIILSVKNQSVKSGLWLIISAIIMLVIGAGACALILSNLNLGGMH